jgi:hypothetical protein
MEIYGVIWVANWMVGYNVKIHTQERVGVRVRSYSVCNSWGQVPTGALAPSHAGLACLIENLF